MAKKIWIKLIKKWGEYKIGDVVCFDEIKGNLRIKKGEGELVDAPKEVKPKKEEPKKEAPKVETADIKPLDDIPNIETAEVTPVIKHKWTKKGGE